MTTGCANWDDEEELGEIYDEQLEEFAADFPSLPPPRSNRTHCIVWSDWASQPKVELERGIRLDTNYYYWPGSWVQNRPGMFTGSGMPMRFADLDGSLIDVYQATTQMTDESEQTYPFNSDALLDRALGPQGYYGVFTANIHTDNATPPEADAIVESALERDVPVVSARQMLTWLDGRNQSSFGSVQWAGNQLSFDVEPGEGAKGLRAMLPTESAIGPLAGIERGGAPVATTIRTIKGVEYAFFDAAAGSYTASYTDEALPVILNVEATVGNDGTATVTWDTDEPADSRVDYGTTSASLELNVSDPELVTSHSLQLSGLEPNTTYYFRVTSADAEANSATEPGLLLAPQSFATPPAAPVLSATIPASPANENAPAVVGSAAAGSTVDLYAGPDCTGGAIASGSAAELETGIAVNVADNSSIELRATATSAAGTSACSAPLAYLEDSNAPETQITAKPAALVNSNDASFEFAGEDPGGSGLAGLECRIDSEDPEAWAACTSPQGYAELADGPHKFEVRAADNAGNADQSPDSHEWTVDTTPPALSIDSGPEGLITDPTPTFAFSSEPGATVECSIDQGTPSFGPCSDPGSHTPESPLPDGPYTFRVRATDAATNQAAATREFEVDATEPQTQIDTAPAALDSSAAATFEFSGSDPESSGVASFECKLDEAAFAPCTSGIEYTELTEGPHEFEVRAIDNAGNSDQSPASLSWTVDSKAPETQITVQPPAFDNNATANFSFTGEDPGGSGVASFECRRDSEDPGDWQPCVSPLKYTSLAQGSHVVEIRAIDKAGNADASPATHEWTIDTNSPETQIDAKPAALVNSAEASFEFSGEDPGGSGVAGLECRIDSEDPEAWTACTSPQGYAELADGAHKFEVRAVDLAGNADQSPASHEWTVDTTPPALSIDSGPEGLTTNPSPVFAFTYSPEPGDTLECSIDSGEAAFGPCSSAASHTPDEPLPNGPYTFRARATDEAGNPALVTREFEVDATVPETQITAEPAALVASGDASFEFTGEDPEGSGVASFQCRRDSEDPEAWTACTSPQNYTELADGAHKFEVRAIDNAGNTDQSPASHEWTVDTEAPDTQIDAQPAALANSAEASFEFSGSDPGGSGVASFQCRRDSTEASDWVSCSSPHVYGELAEGPHKFEVRAIDNAGNVDQSSASYEWTIDSKAPETQIDLAPPSVSNSAKASFEFSGEDPGGSGVASFQCRRDSDEPVGWQLCSSPRVYTSLAEGVHTFEVRAVDQAGGADQTPATFEWEIDTKAPETQIDLAPPSVSNSATAVFSFSGEDPGGSGVASFECKLDEAGFSPCSSGIELTGLGEGSHTFEVRAIDNAGNVDASAASHEWTVDTVAPAVQVDSGPEGLTNDNTPTFGFSSEPGAGFECSIDQGTPAFGPCSAAGSHTPAELLADGEYTFRVRATDAATNQAVATRSFEVDGTAPDTQIDSGPAALVNSATAVFSFSGEDQGGSGLASFECKLDEAAFSACSSGIELTELGEGSHTFEVRAIDNAGNVDASAASHEWTVDTVPPAVQVDSGPEGLTNDNTPTFGFSSEPGAGFECSIDQGTPAFGPCSAAGSHTPAEPLADGEYTFRVRATDAATNQAVATRSFEVDTAAPPAPELSATEPPSPANDNTPQVLGSAPAGTTVRLYTGPDCNGAPIATVTPAELEAGVEATVAGDATTSFRATATTAAENTSGCSEALLYVEDSTAPSTQITAKPAALVNSATAVFSFSGEDPGGSGIASFQCKLDEAAFSPCSSGIELTGLGEGSHTFEVRAIDNAGNVDASAASHEWQIDLTPPPVSVDSGPEGLTNDNTPTFGFSSEPGAGFECSIDQGSPAFGPCSDPESHTPAEPLADGEYTFRVRASDAATNQAVATRSFTVDGTAPDTQIDSGPAALVNSATAVFSFSGEDQGGSGLASFECKLDEAAFSACSSGIELTELGEGSHTFEVRAIDNAGNVDASAASHEWTVDTVGPDTQIDSGPAALVNSATAVFSFSGEDQGGSGLASFECKLDEAAFSACSSGIELTELGEGSHTFEVRAIDNAGNVDASAASHEWTVDTVPPAVQVDSGPEGLTNDNTPTFGFSSEPGAGFECSIDQGTPAFGPCSAAGSHTPAEPLADGEYTFRVRATDAATNQAVATRSFEVDTAAPPAPELSATEPPSPANDNTPQVLGSAPAGTTVRLYTGPDCNGAPIATVTPAELEAGVEATVAGDATTSFRATATTAAENTSGCSEALLYVEDSTAPSTQITAKPAALVNSADRGLLLQRRRPGRIRHRLLPVQARRSRLLALQLGDRTDGAGRGQPHLRSAGDRQRRQRRRQRGEPRMANRPDAAAGLGRLRPRRPDQRQHPDLRLQLRAGRRL